MNLKIEKEHSLLIQFFLLAFVISWLIWLPALLRTLNIMKYNFSNIILVGIGAWGPSVSAFILTYKIDGREGLKSLLKRAFKLPHKKAWLIPTFLLLPCLLGVTYVLYILLHAGNLPELTLLLQPWLIIPLFIFSLLVLGAVQEEFGWRGFALDKLQKRWNALLSSLILGILWAIWHLPLFFIEGTMQQNISFIIFLLGTLGITIIYTWLHNNTQGSILTALIFHAMHNTAFNIFPITLLPFPNRALLYLSIVQIIAALIVIKIYGYQKLVKEKRGISNFI